MAPIEGGGGADRPIARSALEGPTVLVFEDVKTFVESLVQRLGIDGGAGAREVITGSLLAFGEPLPGDEQALRAALAGLGSPVDTTRALTQADVWNAFEDAGWGWVLEKLDDAAGGEQGEEIADRLNERLGLKPGHRRASPGAISGGASASASSRRTRP